MPDPAATTFERKLLYLVSVVAVVVGGWLGIEKRIEAAVAKEAKAREALEQRIGEDLRDIKAELRDLNLYLRDETRTRTQ